MDRVFQHVIHVPGTLTADITPVFTAPFDMQLVHVSAVGSNNGDATIKIGNTSSPTSDDDYLAAAVIGDSNVPVEFDRDNFVGAQYPHIPDGTIMLVTVDFDGAAGTAAADLTVVLTFTEG
jgi:hypothetical protein